VLPPQMWTMFNPRALGSSTWVAGEKIATRAYVNYRAVQRESDQHKTWLPLSRLLAYVMAHETGHLLLRDERHSALGLMMSSWPNKELLHLARGGLAFSSEQARLLQAGVRKRMEASAGTAVALGNSTQHGRID
jgi:hypothetical protein